MASYTTSVSPLTGSPLVIEGYTTGLLGDMAAVTISSIATVLTPTTGTRLILLGGTFSVSADASVLFEDNGSGTTVFRSPLLLAKEPYTFSLGYGKALAAINNVLKATASASATITGTLYYAQQNS